jgi:hypothetical protein
MDAGRGRDKSSPSLLFDVRLCALGVVVLVWCVWVESEVERDVGGME